MNSSRPLVGAFAPRGSRSVLATSRWEGLFCGRPAQQVEVEDLLRDIARRCGPGGTARLALGADSPEYMLWAGLPRFAPGVRLATGAPRPGGPAPCAVVSAACARGRLFCLGGSAP
jgi:hypothetical protein